MMLTASTSLKTHDPRSPQVNLAGFLDAAQGIALCQHGQLLHTQDGGRSWRPSAHPPYSAELEGLEILDGENAWTSGGVLVWKTGDGGRSWEELPDHGPMYPTGRHLSFIDRDVGWYGTASELAATRDGGISWRPLVLPLPRSAAGEVTAIHLLSERVGFVLLYSGALLVTEDGGRSWDWRGLPLRGESPRGLLPETPVEAVRFQDRMHGILVLYSERPLRGFYVLVTSDGGLSWTEEKLPPIGVRIGSVFLSRDGRYLTVNDLDRNRILVLERRQVAEAAR